MAEYGTGNYTSTAVVQDEVPEGSDTPAAAAPVPEVYDSFDLPVIYVRNKTGFEESKEFPIKINSLIAGRYQILEYIGSAAFSKAVQCLDTVTGELVCIKIIKNNKDFFDQSLDEIKLLKYINSNADPDEKCVVQLYSTSLLPTPSSSISIVSTCLYVSAGLSLLSFSLSLVVGTCRRYVS